MRRLVGKSRVFSGRDAKDAILFAIDIDDHYDRLDFLQGWVVGDTSDWPEFHPDLVPNWKLYLLGLDALADHCWSRCFRRRS